MAQTEQTTLVDERIERSACAGLGLPGSLCLVEIFNLNTGLTFQVYRLDASLFVGRSDSGGDSEIELDDAKVSRRHCEVRFLEEHHTWGLIDLDSTNGTYLNGKQIDREFLSIGDLVRVGRSLFVVAETPPERSVENYGLVGGSLSISTLLENLHQVSTTDLKVCITGKTGTGKELVARAIHRISGRKGPFVAVNCGAFPENLIESELFGYERGAFSGADQQKEGLFVSAHGGTLFLDEIGEFPLSLQPRLLRVLEDTEVRPM
jgi:pSer/pThr/pTyr-binding forkhead associated (FHA) protein